MNGAHIPITRNLRLAYTLSFFIGLLMAGVSLVGLLFPDSLYPSNELRNSSIPNDLVNLFIGLPILFGSMWLTRRGELVGLLLWPGALLYVLYNYAAYIFGIPFSLVTMVYMALVLLSAFIIIDLYRSIDRKSVQARLYGSVPLKTAGWVLVVFGVLFFFRAVSIIAQSVTARTTLPASEIGVLIADLVISTLWFAGGAMLLRGMPLGYVSGLGLLFAGSMLLIGLIMFLLLQPLLTDAPFALVDVLVVAVMGLICFIPFALFLRGVLSGKQ